jgi:hypothetical protein
MLITWHPLPVNVDTNFVDKRRSLRRYSSLVDSGHGVFFYSLLTSIHCTSWQHRHKELKQTAVQEEQGYCAIARGLRVSVPLIGSVCFLIYMITCSSFNGALTNLDGVASSD